MSNKVWFIDRRIDIWQYKTQVSFIVENLL